MKFLYAQARPTRFNTMPRHSLSLHVALTIARPEAAGDFMAREYSSAWGGFHLDMARYLARSLREGDPVGALSSVTLNSREAQGPPR
jgi:hypothetical protein